MHSLTEDNVQKILGAIGPVGQKGGSNGDGVLLSPIPDDFLAT